MMVMDVEGGTLDQYEKATKEVFGGYLDAENLPGGLLSHVVVATKGGIKVVDVWDSKAKFRAFGIKLMPAISKAKFPPAKIEFYDVHDFYVA